MRTVLQFFGDDGSWKRGKSEVGLECRRPALGTGARSGDGLAGLSPPPAGSPLTQDLVSELN